MNVTATPFRPTFRIFVAAVLAAMVGIAGAVAPTQAVTGPIGTTIDPNAAQCRTLVHADGSKSQFVVANAPGVQYSSLTFTEARWTAYVQYAPLSGGTWVNLNGVTQRGTVNAYWKSVAFQSQRIDLTSSNKFQFRVLNQVQFLNNGSIIGTSAWLDSAGYSTHVLAANGWGDQRQGICMFP